MAFETSGSWGLANVTLSPQPSFGAFSALKRRDGHEVQGLGLLAGKEDRYMQAYDFVREHARHVSIKVGFRVLGD